MTLQLAKFVTWDDCGEQARLTIDYVKGGTYELTLSEVCAGDWHKFYPTFEQAMNAAARMVIKRHKAEHERLLRERMSIRREA